MPITVLNDTAALCTAPPRDDTTANASTAEAVRLRVSLNGVDFSPSNLTWRYLAPPEVTAVAPRRRRHRRHSDHPRGKWAPEGATAAAAGPTAPKCLFARRMARS